MTGYPPTATVRRPPCGVRRHVAALNWETCLPVPKRSHACALPMAPAPTPEIRETRSGFAPIKAKTPAIKANRASSRHRMNIFKPHKTSANGAAPYQPGQRPGNEPPACPQPCRGVPPANQGTIKPQSRQKTPVIVHDQGKSRQTPFFQTAIHPANPPAGWGAPAVESSKRGPRFSLSAGRGPG